MNLVFDLHELPYRMAIKQALFNIFVPNQTCLGVLAVHKKIGLWWGVAAVPLEPGGGS